MTKLNKQSKVEMEMERKRVRVRVEVGSETVRFLLPISVTFFSFVIWRSSAAVVLSVWFFCLQLPVQSLVGLLVGVTLHEGFGCSRAGSRLDQTWRRRCEGH